MRELENFEIDAVSGGTRAFAYARLADQVGSAIHAFFVWAGGPPEKQEATNNIVGGIRG